MNPYDEKLKEFASDEIMFNAVKQILLSNCDLNDLFKKNAESSVTNADLSDMGRAWWQAGEIIRKGFKDIEVYRNRKVLDKSDHANIV